MTTRRHGKPTSTIGRNEVLRDSGGRVIDEDYVQKAVDNAIAYVRGRGRPSLSESGESPLIRVRVSRDLDAAVREAARTSGESVSDWVRHALEHAANGAPDSERVS